MADYRIVLAQLPTPRAARQAAQALAAAFARHLDTIKQTRRYRGELTGPLLQLAQDEGFAWGASDDDPNFVIGSAGHLLIAYHAAAMQLAEVGLQAFARARGASATTFWDPDPTPGALTIKVAKAAGFARAFARACEDNDLELELSADRPAAGTPRLVIAAGKRTRHAHLVYDGPTIRHASFALRDARALTCAERPLIAASFAGALLDGTDFTKTDASHASFANVSAHGTVFTGATLVGADFSGANLRGASFRDADVRDAIWAVAELAGADFTGARR